jgi:hypothetical protein
MMGLLDWNFTGLSEGAPSIIAVEKQNDLDHD